ncbi:hypothetical protein PoB_004631800 [Plakobranchus ocellatus]|uniref:Uncharacterized protein n=1 Tax=Plakobranchus ocellatus TaxID=259542 RepID=A0AAV4BLX7_9GAST|nr:hypothetical protein PoB_004631800 [Plakobranchus ocellatus]
MPCQPFFDPLGPYRNSLYLPLTNFIRAASDQGRSAPARDLCISLTLELELDGDSCVALHSSKQHKKQEDRRRRIEEEDDDDDDDDEEKERGLGGGGGRGGEVLQDQAFHFFARSQRHHHFPELLFDLRAKMNWNCPIMPLVDLTSDPWAPLLSNALRLGEPLGAHLLTSPNSIPHTCIRTFVIKTDESIKIISFSEDKVASYLTPLDSFGRQEPIVVDVTRCPIGVEVCVSGFYLVGGKNEVNGGRRNGERMREKEKEM